MYKSEAVVGKTREEEKVIMTVDKRLQEITFREFEGK